MSGKTDKRPLSVFVTPDELDRVHNFAKRRGFKNTSDYLRFLIEGDMAAHGEEMTFYVDRGGNRRAPKDE